MLLSQSYLQFIIEEECYALPLNAVKTVIRAVELTRLPDSPPILKGLLNMRGEIVPVLNIRSRFGLPESNIRIEDRIILCYTAERVIAFVVDLVIGVVEVGPEEFAAATQILPGMEPCIEGVAKLGKETVLLYDLNKLFSIEDMRSVEIDEPIFYQDSPDVLRHPNEELQEAR